MGLTSAMLVGFSGIQSNQQAMDTIGDNVANVNTTAFKNQRATFETVFYRTISEGSAPTADNGGSNPLQVGYGSRLAALQRNFEQGTIQPTGVKSDVAIDGDGFLVIQNASDEQLYTRDGSLELNTDNVLVTADGSFVQGFTADETGTITPGTLSNLTIPLGTESVAQATTSAVLQGNLDAAAEVATTGSVTTSAPLQTASGAAAATTQLTALVDDDGGLLFSAGDTITVRNVQVGGSDLPEAGFVVGEDGSTLGDLATFLQTTMGIDPSVPTASGQTPGVTVATDGSLVVTSNAGESNAISLESTNIRNDTTGLLPFSFTSAPAAGDGVSTGFTVYDSLGNPVEVRVRTALESRTDAGSTWRFFVEAPGNADGRLVGNGTLSFDQNGQLVDSTGTDVGIPAPDSGAATPVNVALDFSGVTGLNFGSERSALVMATQDGMPGGTLVDYAINAEGIIEGTYSNGQKRDFGQLAIATFRNDGGLAARGDNTYAVGLNSGEAVISAPKTNGAGAIQSYALELSNVDLSREFVNLITASTGFSAASRVVRTSDDLLQELMLLAR